MLTFTCRYLNIFYVVFRLGIRIKYHFVNNWKWWIVYWLDYIKKSNSELRLKRFWGNFLNNERKSRIVWNMKPKRRLIKSIVNEKGLDYFHCWWRYHFHNIWNTLMRLFSKRIQANIFDLKKSVRDNLQTFKLLFYF